MIPDLIVSDGEQSYLVGVAVTHKVGHRKLLKIRELIIARVHAMSRANRQEPSVGDASSIK